MKSTIEYVFDYLEKKKIYVFDWNFLDSNCIKEKKIYLFITLLNNIYNEDYCSRYNICLYFLQWIKVMLYFIL